MVIMKLKRIIFVFVLFLFNSIGNADVRVISISDLVPLEKHIKATELITHILTTYHYKKTEIDDALSNLIFKNYFENLDQNKAYFINYHMQHCAALDVYFGEKSRF